MNSPVISIVMGVYNDQHHLEKCIKSILNQTYKNFEFIICNDCSTDDSGNIIEAFQKTDSRIVYIENKKNLGLGDTLNKCIDIAKGLYIARMDSDDICLENRLKNQVEYMIENPKVDVLGTLAYYIDENDNVMGNFKRIEEVTLSNAVKMSQVIHPTVLMKKKTLIKVNGYTVTEITRRAEDYDLWCKILMHGGVIKNLQSYEYLYREDLNGLKKRKYKYRLQEFKIKYQWMKKTKQPIFTYIYCIKPLLVGLVPAAIVNKKKKGGVA